MNNYSQIRDNVKAYKCIIISMEIYELKIRFKKRKDVQITFHPAYN
jgi:hypothetical protein